MAPKTPAAAEAAVTFPVTLPECPRAPVAAVRNVPLLKRGVGDECEVNMFAPVVFKEDAKDDEAVASRLIFFFFLALEGVEETGPALPPPERDVEGFGL